MLFLQDGRLQINDQLLEVNNNSLIDLPNTESMNILCFFLQDGRLQINDQLLEVNNNSLIDLPNTESMDILCLFYRMVDYRLTTSY